MNSCSFKSWLNNEVTFARCALLTLYEQKDKLQYIDGPRLEKEYIEAVGTFEETVIREEIECELLRIKKQMVQIVINRHEPIDEAAIDAEISLKRQEKLNDAVGLSAPTEYASLSAQQTDELQELYNDIIKNFHPQMHPELTQAHRRLFQKAQEAYRRRDLDALKLAHEMLFSTVGGEIAIELLIDVLLAPNAESDENETRDFGFVTDYALASQIYNAFKPTVEETAIQEECVRYRQITDSVMSEIEQMRLRFPYIAADMLSDPQKIQEYKDKLSYRLLAATNERAELTQEIRGMIEGVAARG